MDITEVLMASTSVVISIVMLVLIRTTKTEAQRREALQWVNVAVNAVEQMAGTASGQQKKQQVKQFLAKQGLVYDGAKLDMAIEAEVNKMRKKLSEEG